MDIQTIGEIENKEYPIAIYRQQQVQITDPNTNELLPFFTPHKETITVLEAYRFTDDSEKPIIWTNGQIEIIDCILWRQAPDGKKRIEIIASTQYGKSLAVAAGVVIRSSLKPEKWAIVAGTEEKARIIMEYAIMLALNHDGIRAQLTPDTSLDRLRMKKSADRLTFRCKGEIRVFSAEAKNTSETSKALMGFGSPNVIEDEAALINDILQATVMRMLGGTADNFLIKIGNPFTRGHFWRTWRDGNYYRIFIDYKRALSEHRYTEDFINEMREEAMFGVLYACLFPDEAAMDLKGWTPLLTLQEIERATVEAEQPFGTFRLGNDVAGGGRNFSVCVLRAYNVARIIYKKNQPDTMMFTGEIIHFQQQLGVNREDVFIDKVGIGKGPYDRLRENNDRVVGVNAGDEPADKSRYVNLRAEMYWRLREWVLHGGKLEKSPDWNQLSKIKYKVADSSGKIKIMSKEEMLKEGVDSPDVADALSLTFAHSDIPPAQSGPKERQEAAPTTDPY